MDTSRKDAIPVSVKTKADELQSFASVIFGGRTCGSYAYMAMLEAEIKQLSGFDLETLRKMFAAGWTLKPPERREYYFRFPSLETMNKQHFVDIDKVLLGKQKKEHEK